MSSPSDDKSERLLELSIDRALAGLTSQEEVELVSLLPPGAELDIELELAAAAIHLTNLDTREPLPQALRDRVLASITASPATPHTSDEARTVPLSSRPANTTEVMPRAIELPSATPAALPSRSGSRRVAIAGWLAAAACLVLAFLGWTRQLPLPESVRPAPLFANRFRLPTAPVLPPPTAGERRDKLAAEAKDLTRIVWGATNDPASKGATGEVVWSQSKQEGYMSFRALEVNDPKTTQYQLWIFDGSRDDRYPVDGGVFDIPAGSDEIIVPITAKVLVKDPTLFAVTVEKPGGVVVSKRERIVVAAKVKG